MTTMTRIDRGSTETTKVYSEGGDLVFERTFDAPRELVWKAFTEARQVERWWGPHGHVTRVIEMDLRVGGHWRYVSRTAEGDEFAFYGEYLAIDPIDRIEWTFMFDVEGLGPQGGPEEFIFEDLGDRTTVRSVGHMGSVEVLEGALAVGMVPGALETWDRLAAALAEDTARS